MADSDSEIEFNMEPNNREMGDDRPDSDTEEHDQEHEDARLDRAASVLSSLEGMPALEDVPIQHPCSKRALEGEYLGIPIDQDKALYLAACLRGNAQVYYMTLKVAERSSYHTLTVKLGQRFGNTRQQPMWISRLEARMRKPNESVAELGDDLRRLAQRAYSNMNHDAREMLALNQLYKSVSPDLKYKCISENCTSVTKAVSIIETYEGILGEESSKKKMIRQAATDDSPRHSNQPPTNYTMGNDDLQSTLRQLQNSIEMLTRQCNNQVRNQDPRDRNGQRLCYICLSPRHLQRDCPQNPRNRRDQRPAQRPHQYPRGEAYNNNHQENRRPSTQ